MQIFSKALSKTDVNKRCVVPMKYFKMKRFPKLEGKDKVRFGVKDESGKDWTLCCYKRKIGYNPDRPKHPKPVLIEGWIPFVRENKLCVGDTVIIDEEQDETGLIQLRIKVKKLTSPSEARWPPVKNENLDGNKRSATNNSATAAFKPFGNHSDVLDPDLGGTNAAARSSIDKEQMPTPHSTSQDIARYNTERQSLNLSLELTLKPTMTGRTTAATSSSIDNNPHSTSQDRACYKTEKKSLELTLKPTTTKGTTAATSSSIDKEQTPAPLSTSQDIACYRTEWPSLSLSLELTPNSTMTWGQHHVYMQETETRTIDFLGSFL